MFPNIAEANQWTRRRYCWQFGPDPVTETAAVTEDGPRRWSVSIGQGALRVTLGYPSGPFTHGYRDSTPRLAIDGIDRTVTWGTQLIPLPAGPHAVKIMVYAEGGDAFGRAETPVTIGLGAQTALVYRAPRFHGSRGKVKVTAMKPE